MLPFLRFPVLSFLLSPPAASPPLQGSFHTVGGQDHDQERQSHRHQAEDQDSERPVHFGGGKTAVRLLDRCEGESTGVHVWLKERRRRTTQDQLVYYTHAAKRKVYLE